MKVRPIRKRRTGQIVDCAIDAHPQAPARLHLNRDFLRVWLGQVITQLGNGISLIATPLLVLALTNSPAQAGIVAACRTAPYLFLGLPAGALVDRWNRRTVLIFCDAARALAMGSVPIAWLMGTLSIGQLIAVALVQGVAVSFSNIAQTASLPRLVRKEQIASAQALQVSSLGIASLVGPGVGGVVVALGRSTAEGAAIAFAADALTYLVSMATLATVRRPFQGERPSAERSRHGVLAGHARPHKDQRTIPPSSLRDEILVGLKYLWADHAIRLLAIVNCVHRVCVGSVVVLPVIVLGRDVLLAEPSAIGLIVGAAGAGGLFGSVVTPPIRRRVSVGWHMVAVVTLHGLGIGAIALADGVLAAMAGMFVVGAAEAMTSIVQVSYRLATIPDALQGRVNSVYRLGSFAAMTVGTAAAGLLIEASGARAALATMALYVLAVALGTGLSGVRRI